MTQWPTAPYPNMEGIISDLSTPLDNLTLAGGHDGYSSTSYSGVSESHSSHSPHHDHDTELSSGYINDYSELDSLNRGFGTDTSHELNPGVSHKDIALSVHSSDGDWTGMFESFQRLPDLDRCPWSEQEVLTVR